jgi:hypothetical protein
MEDTMKTLVRVTLPAFALLASIAVAQAQTGRPDHETHHPGPGASMPMQGPMQGMMGGMPGGMPMDCSMMRQTQNGAPGSMPMMGMMGQRTAMAGMGMGGMGMPFEHIEGRIAFLKAEIGITEAQQSQWNAFADALRRSAEAHRTMHQEMMGQQSAAVSNWPERVARRANLMSTHTDALKAIEATVRPLYNTLTEEQKQKADRLLSGPMGMM